MIFTFWGASGTNSTYREKWYPECFNLNEAVHVPRLSISPDWNSRLIRNKFRNFKKFDKIVVKTIVKSGRCPRRFCRGGVLLTEFETSPLQVIWTLRACAALWSSRTVFWEPEPAENHDFQDFQDFHILRCLMTNSCPPEKRYLKCFNLNETLHVPRLNISSDWNSRLQENEFTDFKKFRKIVFQILVKSGRCFWRSSRGGVLLSEYETSPLQVT